MKRLNFLLLPVLLLFAASQARADINWTANWTPGSPSLTVGPSSVIDFTSLTNAGFTTPTGSTSPIAIPVTNLSIVTTAPASAPDVFSNKGYSMNLLLTDSSSGMSQSFTFTGALSGSVSTGGGTISNVFGPNSTQSVTFADGDSYKIVFNGFLPPGSGQNITTAGGLGTDVYVYATGPGNSGTPHGTPEPSTLALGGLGMTFTSLMAWRKRRTQRV